MQNKTRLAKIIDHLTLFFCILFVLAIIINNFVKSNLYSIIISSFLTILIYVSLVREIKKRGKKRNLTRAEENKLNSVLFALKFGAPEKLETFWIKVLSKLYTTQKRDEFIEIKSDTKTALCYFDFRVSSFDTPEMFYILRLVPQNVDIFIFSNSFSEDVIQFSIINSRLHLFDGKSTFMLLKKLNIFPKLSKPETARLSKRAKFLGLLTRKNSFKFLRYGLLLLVLSLIIPYSLLYKIFGGILILLGLIALFRREYHTTPTPELIL